ncbi:helix-turn-helix transcriptional regulator [Mycobacteroides abscessus]|uniref:helix-turn-helix transcriptional regulator n=1 Tax=Mycobacteroides abscessus TaxID=36809 RepID=UPI000C2640A7|nr:helix-turn-helix domain-containing protein [Mycobacteroides abscessus]
MTESDEALVLVTTKVAAQILRIHPETLREWVREGRYEIPKPIRVGSRFRWDLEELRAYVKSRQIPA